MTYNMKKITFLALVLLGCLGLTSCNDEWNDELYEQMVSFKSQVGSNGVYDVYMRYHADGSARYELPVIVSGSQSNKHDITVNIGVDNDTLNMLNQVKYAVNRQDLWYKQLPEQYYNLDTTTCTIPAGQDVALFPVKFNMKGIDLSDEWVLPLTIEPSPDYKLNTRKGWYKALMHVKLFNDFSGTYSANTLNAYIDDGQEKDPATESTREAKVINDSTIFVYAGTIWDEDVNRKIYEVAIRILPGTKNEDGAITGPVEVWLRHPNDKVDFKVTGACSYYYKAQPHETKPNIERRQMTIYLDYKFTDYTTDPSNPLRYHVKGNMSMERLYNMLIPDADQAILW